MRLDLLLTCVSTLQVVQSIVLASDINDITQAISNLEPVIKLTPGFAYNVGSTININYEVTIESDGDAAILDLNGGDRHFHVKSTGNLKLRGIRLVNANLHTTEAAD